MPAEQASEQPFASKGLDRDAIVRAALDSIDRNGAQGLTMRGLALDLGVEAMSLYRYVAGREDLLEGVVTLLLQDLSKIDQQLGRTWQGYLQGLAHAVRRIAVEHPSAFPLVATRHPATPWLRPPLRSLELVEDFLATLSGHGLPDEQVVHTYQAFSGFLLGNLLLEAALRGAETSPVEEPLDEGNATIPSQDGQVDLSNSPTVARFRPLLSQDRSAEEFETSLETLLDRLEMELSQ